MNSIIEQIRKKSFEDELQKIADAGNNTDDLQKDLISGISGGIINKSGTGLKGYLKSAYYGAVKGLIKNIKKDVNNNL